MSNPNHIAGAALALSCVFFAGCPAQETPQPGSDAQREPEGGGEVWRATTRAPGRSTRPSWVTIAEEVRLDGAGKLLFSETRVKDDAGSPEVHVTCDVRQRVVVIERAGRRIEWSVSGDEPWILAPVVGPTGETIPTPLVAWTTWRAAQASDWLRLVRPFDQRSFVVPRDQYVVGDTVVVGEQAVEVDAQFVRSIAIGGATLARGRETRGSFRFRGG